MGWAVVSASGRGGRRGLLRDDIWWAAVGSAGETKSWANKNLSGFIVPRRCHKIWYLKTSAQKVIRDESGKFCAVTPEKLVLRRNKSCKGRVSEKENSKEIVDLLIPKYFCLIRCWTWLGVGQTDAFGMGEHVEVLYTKRRVREGGNWVEESWKRLCWSMFSIFRVGEWVPKSKVE